MQLGISERDGLLASVGAKSRFIEEIKAKNFEDLYFDEVRTMIEIGKSQGTTLDVGCVLNYKDRLCVPRVDNLISRLLVEAHGSRYSIHSRVTNMYRDMKQVY